MPYFRRPGHIYDYEFYCVIGKELQCERELGNDHGMHAASVMKGRQIVGHVLQTISRPCSVSIRNSGMIKCTVTGNHRYCRCKGMEERGSYIFCFIGIESWVKKDVYFILIQTV